jgi:hypothetical protein
MNRTVSARGLNPTESRGSPGEGTEAWTFRGISSTAHRGRAGFFKQRRHFVGVAGHWERKKMKHVHALIAAASIAVLGISAFAADPTVPGDAAQPIPGAVPIAANMSPDGIWFNMAAHPAEVMNAQPWVRPARGQATMLDLGAMMTFLRAAPLEGTQLAFDAPLIVWLPRPDGTFERFRVVESPIMEPGLAALLPGTKTFLGQGLDNPANIVRFDHTLEGAGAGFHAMVLSPDGDYFIDPVSRDDMQHYVSYFKREFRKMHAWACLTETDPNRAPVAGDVSRDIIRAGPTRREYSLAVAATGEYTAFHGGTATAGQNAIVTAMNRVNGVYEREVAVRMILVANNINVVYTNAGTDPYNNNDPGQMLSANTGNLNSIIGSANYDIGHVFSTGGGGVAFLGSVCGGSKGGGVTGTNTPVGDPFTIDYVAHEMGHQFGGNHTFNGTGGACSGNRASSAAYEPGSATTIMGYAGICGTDNVQNNSDAYFHSRSFDEIIAFTTGAGNGCATQVATGNTAPTVSAGNPFAIPRNTPFTLTATGSDPNGDALTFCWEERELGAAQTLGAADNGASPNFRSFTGTTSPSRTFPRLSTVLGGTAAPGEKVYSVARNPASFRVTARDNRAGGGGVNTSDINLVVDGAAGPFILTAPTGGSSFAGGSNINVTWNVAGTTAVPINTANVRILLSTDGGTTFGTVLAASTPNDGSQSVALPNVATTTARIRVEAINNIFFNVNPGGNFTLTIAPPATPTSLTATPNPGCVNQNLTLNATVGAGEVCDWFIGNCGLTLVGTGNPLVITPTAPFTNRTYFARARRTSDGATSAACATIQVTVNFNPVAPTSASVDRNNFCASDAGNIVLSAAAGAGTTLRWSTGSCGGTTVGTGNNLSIPSPTTTTTYFARWETNCGVSSCAAVTVNVGSGPSISTQPASQSIASGSPVTFSVVAAPGIGGGSLTYQWRKNAVDIGGATSSSYNIPSVTAGDAGTYSVRVTDSCGNVLSANAVLTVTGGCPADFNNDGAVDFFDYLDFVAAYDAELPSADFNNDGNIDFFDYLDFVAAFDTGC